jgi:hypothetical protein
MPISRDRRAAILRTSALQANPYLAGVFDRLCADLETRGASSDSYFSPSGEVEKRATPRTLEDYIRSREPGEEG